LALSDEYAILLSLLHYAQEKKTAQLLCQRYPQEYALQKNLHFYLKKAIYENII
jgi:hypothetical protein